MEIREVMTESVVTATPDAPVRHIAELMRERNVGSVVLVDDSGLPIGFITDRDLAVSVVADGHPADTPAGGHASSPVAKGDPMPQCSAGRRAGPLSESTMPRQSTAS